MIDRASLLAWSKKYCNNPDLVDADDFSIVLDRLSVIFSNSGVASQGLGDYSVSFSDSTALSVKDILYPYKIRSLKTY